MTVFFFNDTATTEIYTLSLHDALPISQACSTTSGSCTHRCPRLDSAATSPAGSRSTCAAVAARTARATGRSRSRCTSRSEEHTSELQSRQYLVCRLLLEKKKQ